MISGVWEVNYPLPTDETGASNLPCGAFEFETTNDNGVLTDVDRVPALEGSDNEVVDWPETSEMPDNCFDYCFSIDLIASNDDYGDYCGCVVATDSDEFEMDVINVMQKIVSVDEVHRVLFMEEMIDESVYTDHVEEEEEMKISPHEQFPR